MKDAVSFFWKFPGEESVIEELRSGRYCSTTAA